MSMITYIALSRMLQGIYVDEEITITPDMAREIVSALGQEKNSLPPHRHIAGRDGNIDECHACGRDIRTSVHTRGQ
jgi:hypothetical protein